MFKKHLYQYAMLTFVTLLCLFGIFLWYKTRSLSFTSTSHAQPQTPTYSTLWGREGENWDPAGRLPDFSYAGYMSQKFPIPYFRQKINIKDAPYSAKGDGVSDDTPAFEAAIRNITNGAIFIPEGRYKLTQRLYINKPNVVLRGAGKDKTTLYYPDPLEVMAQRTQPPYTPPGGFWSWSGGVIWVEGENDKGSYLADITASAQRGDKKIIISNTQNVKVGSYILLSMVEQLNKKNDPAYPSLGKQLHENLPGYDLLPGMLDWYRLSTDRTSSEYNLSELVRFVAQIVAIDGNTITLDRPLRVRIDAQWLPRIYTWNPSVENVGIDDLTIRFENVNRDGTREYRPHNERGYNGISFIKAANTWVRNVDIIDSDTGISLEYFTRFITLDHVRIRVDRREPNFVGYGHHAIQVGVNQDSLITNFSIERQFYHDLTVANLAFGNVFMNGEGEAIALDHHSSAPYENLFSNIKLGNYSRMWQSTGMDFVNKTGARETYWNLQTTNGNRFPPPEPLVKQYPYLNIIGNNQHYSYSPNTAYAWFEDLQFPQPQELFTSQLMKRTKNTLADFLKGWPVQKPETNEIFISPNGELIQVITKGTELWARTSTNTDEWYVEPLLTSAAWPSTCGTMPSSLSTNNYVPFAEGSSLRYGQLITWDNRSAFRNDIRFPFGKCRLLNDSSTYINLQLDASSIFTWQGKTAQWGSMGSTYFKKNDINTASMEQGYLRDLGITASHLDTASIFTLNNHLIGVFTEGSQYWVLIDLDSRTPQIMRGQISFTNTNMYPKGKMTLQQLINKPIIKNPIHAHESEPKYDMNISK